MGKILMILEVSQKQAYIFSSKKLKENAVRSADINYVTSSRFFQETAETLYDEQSNFVYSGGGHTVLQFEDKDSATHFASVVTETALRQFSGVELFVKQLAYDPEKSPGDNLLALTQALERKKSLREASFRQMDLGLEALDPGTFQPVELSASKAKGAAEGLAAPAGYTFPVDFAELAGAGKETDNFIAVIHIDGNAMGKRVEKVYKNCSDSWLECCKSLRRFSEGIQRDFESAFLETADEVIRRADIGSTLPIRPVILAGDDVCFVTAGKIGLECARIFLERLAAKTDSGGDHYAACAGVALVHQKYPFHLAYRLAEELCSNAKRFGAEIDKDGGVSAIDWHIEFGQLKDSLSALREDYITEDGCRLELRPLAVLWPEEADLGRNGDVRTYQFFKAMCREMQRASHGIARSKVKGLRTALKQGKMESQFFLQESQALDLLYCTFDARFRDENARLEQYRKALSGDGGVDKSAFLPVGKSKVERCLYFDAIEVMDHCRFLEEAEV